ncbi:hypothetical protein ACHAWF_010654 [Thalassiosira exigua]
MDGRMSNGGAGKSRSWECSACTWINENEHGLSCMMCQTERRMAPQTKAKGGDIAAANQMGERDCVAPAAAKQSASCDGADSAMRGAGSRLNSRRRGEATEPSSAQTSRVDDVGESSEKIGMAAEGSRTRNEKTAEREDGKWDAFASFASNYQSSDSDGEDQSDGGDSGNGDEGNEGESGQWDAFKSFEQNYESSEDESDDESSDGESRCSEGGSEGGEIDCERPHSPQKQDGKIDADVDCVDLMDSDCSCELVVTRPGKENNSRSSRRKQPQKHEPYTIGDDSDSSLSEVESRRPLSSPRSRPAPPWQRRRSTPIGQNDSLKARDSFSCLEGRNDIMGGSGLGLGGFQLSRKDNETPKGTKTIKGKPRKGSTSASKTTRKRKSSGEATSSKSTATKKRKRSSSKAAVTGKKRRKRSYRKSGKKRSAKGRASSGNGRSNRSSWNAREQGIRQPYNRRGGGGESGPYMSIAKQEPTVRNVGFAMEF